MKNCKKENIASYDRVVTKTEAKAYHRADIFSGDLDQTLRSVASDLVLYCLPMSHKRTLKYM